MIKMLRLLICCIYWLWLFIIPAGTACFIAYMIYQKNGDSAVWPAVIIVTGVLCGACLAEWIRRKYGLENFFGGFISVKKKE